MLIWLLNKDNKLKQLIQYIDLSLMKTGDSISFTTNPSNPNSRQNSSATQQNAKQNLSVIQIATHLVQSVSNMLCWQIHTGNLQVDELQIPFKLKKQHISSQQLIVQAKTIDPEQHKRIVSKFKSLNKRMRRQRQMRSLQLSERASKLKQEQQRLKQEQKTKCAQQRRKQIQKRLQDKKRLMRQISKSILQTSSRVQEVKKKKFLYQAKQDDFYNQVTLPKILQQKKILQKKKQLRIPINLSELRLHQQSYKKLKSQKQLNRTINLKMMNTKDNQYQPPQFVPESYRLVQQQDAIKKQQEALKRKQLEIFQLRKRQYIRKLDEKRQQQKLLSNSHSKSPKAKRETSIQKIKLNRQQIKMVGNEYMKQLVKYNKQISTARKIRPIKFEQPQIKTQRKIKSYFQIDSLRKSRIQKVEKIRAKKIEQIAKSSKLDEVTKYQRLQHQINKLDQELNNKSKSENNIEQANQTAGILINTIQAKIALLQISNKK